MGQVPQEGERVHQHSAHGGVQADDGGQGLHNGQQLWQCVGCSKAWEAGRGRDMWAGEGGGRGAEGGGAGGGGGSLHWEGVSVDNSPTSAQHRHMPLSVSVCAILIVGCVCMCVCVCACVYVGWWRSHLEYCAQGRALTAHTPLPSLTTHNVRRTGQLPLPLSTTPYLPTPSQHVASTMPTHHGCAE